MNFSDFLEQSDSNLDPVKQREAAQRRLDTLTTAVATQAMWDAGKSRFLAYVIGFLIVPALAFHGATALLDSSEALEGLVGLVAWTLGGVVVWKVAPRFVESDPEAALQRRLPALKAEEAKFVKRWGKPKY